MDRARAAGDSVSSLHIKYLNPLPSGLENIFSGYNHVLDFKLDWLLARGVRPLRAGEAGDLLTGQRSLGPGCVEVPRLGPERISDHAPIYADVALNGTLA